MAEQLANFGETTIAEDLDDSETTVTVTDGSVFPASGNFRVIVDDELMLVTARSTNDLTVTRGAESTSAVTHSNGADIKMVLTKAGLDQYLTENSVYTATSFPTGVTGLRVRRSDLDYLIFFYDGTRWVTEQVFSVNVSDGNNSFSATTIAGRATLTFPHFSDLWLMDFHVGYIAGSTNDATHHWTIALEGRSSALVATTLASISTSGDTGGTGQSKSVAIDALKSTGSQVYLDVLVTKVNSPSNLSVGCTATFRGIAT